MSALRDVAEDYLRMRRSLGYKLKISGWQLEKFVTYLEQTGAATITIENRARLGDVHGRGSVVLGAAAVDRASVRPPLAHDRSCL